jgi:RecJ-like exonuclease
MAHEPTDLSAERRWLAHAQQFRDAVLDNVWCSRCRGAVRILDYTVQPKTGGIALVGSCVTCGNEVARYIGDNE